MTDGTNTIDPNRILSSDETDYAPGSTATFTLSGIEEGAAVTFTSQVVDPVTGAALNAGDTWTITDGGIGDADGLVNGSVSTNYFIDPAVYTEQTFVVIAQDAESGDMQSMTLTDGIQYNSPPELTMPTANTLDLTGAIGASGTINGAIFYVPDQKGALGSGTFQAFDRIDSNDPTEQGYNTSARFNGTSGPITDPNNESNNDPNFTTALKLSDMATVNAQGVADPNGAYYAFKLDINQDSHNPDLSLDAVQIWQAPTGDVNTFTPPVQQQVGNEGTPGLAGGTLVYDLDSNGDRAVLLDSTLVGKGSGNYVDMVMLVPTANFDPSHGDYVYLYSAFGQQGTVNGVSYANNSGFEEWGYVANGTPANPALTIDKQTVEGSAHGDGLTILAGQNIDWQYTITNTGNVALSNVVVVDNNGTPNNSADDFTVGTITSLAAGASVTLTHAGVAVDGVYANTATATGAYINGTTTTSVTASDVSNYTGINPSLTVDKQTVEGTAHGDGLTILAGQNINWQYTVTNTGDVALNNVVVVDNNGTPNNSADDFTVGTITSLAAGASVTLTYAGVAVDGAYANTATATASVTDSGNVTVTPTASDASNYTGVNPSLSVDKQTVEGAAHGDGLTILAGQNIDWQYTVTNTGDVALTNITVVDDNGTPNNTADDFSVGTITSLAAGASVTLTHAGVAIDGAYANSATATASFTDAGGAVAIPTSTDVSNYTGVNPSLAIDKQTVEGSVHGDGLTILAGQNISWQYTVTNTGDVALTNITVVDDNGTPNNTADDFTVGTIASLAAGASVTLTHAGVAVDGAYVNHATATASFTDAGGAVAIPTGTDVSSYTGIKPSADVEKLVSVDGGLNWYFTPDNANDTIAHLSSITGINANNLHIGTPETFTGSQVWYEGVVTNTGDVALNNLTLTDNPGTLVFTLAQTSLAAGATELSNIVKTTAVLGSSVTDTLTVNGTSAADAAGIVGHATDSDSVAYQGVGAEIAGLSKGFWAQHLQIWDTTTSDDSKWVSSNYPTSISQGSDINVAPTFDWNHSGSITLTTVATNGNSAGGATSPNGDSGLLLGDLNHDGIANDGTDLFFDLYSAQQLINSSTSANDARQILGSQAIAAQLNDYNGHFEPTGLIEMAVNWLSGTGLIPTGGQAGNSIGSNVDVNTANDVNGVKMVISDGLGSDYSTSGGISFAGLALTTNSAAWNQMSSAAVLTNYTDIHGVTANVYADGEGLKNALQAFNTDQLVVSSDGKLIGWNNGSAIVDVHANTAGMAFGIMHDQGVTGTDWHL